MVYKINMTFNQISELINQKKYKQALEKIEENQKEFLLREQLKFIRKELGEDGEATDAENFEVALGKLKAPKEVKDKILKETHLKDRFSKKKEG